MSFTALDLKLLICYTGGDRLVGFSEEHVKKDVTSIEPKDIHVGDKVRGTRKSTVEGVETVETVTFTVGFTDLWMDEQIRVHAAGVKHGFRGNFQNFRGSEYNWELLFRPRLPGPIDPADIRVGDLVKATRVTNGVKATYEFVVTAKNRRTIYPGATSSTFHVDTYTWELIEGVQE